MISRNHRVTETHEARRSLVDGGRTDSATRWRDGVRQSLTYSFVYRYVTGIVGVMWGATAGFKSNSRALDHDYFFQPSIPSFSAMNSST